MKTLFVLFFTVGILSACAAVPDKPAWLAPHQQAFRGDPDFRLGRDAQNDHWLEQIHENNEGARDASMNTEHN